jgi:hypothetical protein
LSKLAKMGIPACSNPRDSPPTPQNKSIAPCAHFMVYITRLYRTFKKASVVDAQKEKFLWSLRSMASNIQTGVKVIFGVKISSTALSP